MGITAFGGPAAHIAMMRQEFVERRAWLSDEEYADMIGAANLVPGPNSTEVAIHVGYRRLGWIGLLLAGTCFILPAALIVGMIASLYQAYGKLPEVKHVMEAIKPVVIAIILHALWGLSKAVVKKPATALLAAASCVGGYFGLMPLLMLFGSGILSCAAQRPKIRALKPLLVLMGSIAIVAAVPWLLSLAPTGETPGRLQVFLSFFKIGSVLYGSGYVLLSFLKADMIVRHHWLTQTQLFDAIAVGQFTPGPVFTTATFIGYLLGGPTGAVAATVGIFLPAFAFVAISGRSLRGLREDRSTGAFLDGVNAAALGLIVAVTIQLGLEALRTVTAVVLAILALAILLRFKLNSAWLILAAGVVGLVSGKYG